MDRQEDGSTASERIDEAQRQGIGGNPGDLDDILGTEEDLSIRTDITSPQDVLPHGDERGPRIAHFVVESNNATHIQQVVLTLLDAGFGVETTWQEDGAWVSVYWDDAVVEPGD